MYTLRELFRRFQLESVNLNIGVLDATITITNADALAAWDLYVELLTRITTQPLDPAHGDEKTALKSVSSIFPTTRAILRHHGRKTINFSKIAIPVLNQIIRPFTAKWHLLERQRALSDPDKCQEFRAELKQLQGELCNYSGMLAELAGVEDLTDLEINLTTKNP